MKIKSLKNIINEYLEGTKFEEINNLLKIEQLWKKTVGEIIFKKTKIIKFEHNILLIKTNTPVWRNELTLQKNNLIKKINRTKNINVKEIIFK